MRQEPRKLLFRLSVVLIVSINIFFYVLFLLLELHLDLIDKYSTKYFPASIFAYGQTSSGKTFTMSGITEYTMADIYDHIERVIKTPLYHPLSSLSVP